jgi:Homeodomain-like domain-containing protein
MFVYSGHPRKPDERAQARRLRREHGTPIKRIAAILHVSPSSVHKWTADIRLSPEQRRRNYYDASGPLNPDDVARRARAWAEKSRERRRQAQEEGRLRAREGDPLHMAGCMLYWAEGTKGRNTARLVNSDVHLVQLFGRFIRDCFGLDREDFRLGLKFYTGNGLSVREIEHHWLEALDLPRSALRRHIIDVLPTSSSGQRTNRIPHGVATLAVRRSTYIVQHIYGAIQEYAAFDEPAWLDCAMPSRPSI